MSDARYQTHPVDGAKMVLIPSGTFTMGMPEDDIFAKEHEKPSRTVFLFDYWIDVYPVTNLRFERFIEDSGYENRELWSEQGWNWKEDEELTAPAGWNRSEWNAPNQPTTGVSWHEAHAYCRWAGKNLPTEAHWERAARGLDGRRFPWGDDWPRKELVNFNNNVGHVTEVGSYPEGASPTGCFDMSGNVNNWCLDWYWPGFYAYAKQNGLENDPVLDDRLKKLLAIDAPLKCDRGGGYATADECHEVLSCTDKVAWQPEARELWNGFRTVMRDE
ncbi:MAG: SUMF1/EgtB/PvdO family nonheme iron enzyme [Planctomycetota bacterium]|nr:SUMF1/EgtB/PvdO family nonheme iron enzyme [Planctomycetota bacterium]